MQDEGDHWLELGLTLVEGGQVNAKVVEHTDDYKTNLIYDEIVSFTVGSENVFENEQFKLTVKNPNSANPKADLMLLKDGLSINEPEMTCYKNAELIF